MAKLQIEFKNYGLTTVGERGQLVIPKKIRQLLKIKPGDSFLVICRDKAMISLIKPEKFDKIISNVVGQLKSLKH